MLKEEFFILDCNTDIVPPSNISKSIQYGLDIFTRDMNKVIKKEKFKDDLKSKIILRYAENSDYVYKKPESFEFLFHTNPDYKQDKMEIVGSDDLGIIYGLLHISYIYLGIEAFWFWQDKEPDIINKIRIPAKHYISNMPKVRFRGWFVNDEVCLIGWTNSYPPPKEVWFPVFEALLRCKGNMVIPGTDLPRNGIHWKLAEDMGLYITQHHAEPLGAEMFSRTYPNKEAVYDNFSHLFEKLWIESVEKQKEKKVVWVLGFRGQGDCPFWEQDKSYETPKKRGDLISRVLKRQHEILCEYIDNPVYCTYLYGEITDLYRKGYIKIPDGTIKIWSDNGYGKMVSRRQKNHNPRVNSLPEEHETGLHGIYYHVTFHDLQASNHLTMFPNKPDMIKEEITNSFKHGANKFILINSGNIRQHVYFLEIVSKLWNNGNLSITNHLKDFCKRYYYSNWKSVYKCYLEFFNCTIKYGSNYDDKAGEEFYHHSPRSIISSWMKGETKYTNETLIWATGNIDFKNQIEWFHKKLVNPTAKWENLLEQCNNVLITLNKDEKTRFKGTFFFQVKLHYTGCKGFLKLCKSFFAYTEKKYPLSFILASQSLLNYKNSLKALQEVEYGKWKNFYRADWLTNIKGTIYSIEALQRFLRMHGDSPDFFLWFRQYIVPESERIVLLENTTRRMLSDDELAKELLKVINDTLLK